MLRPIMKRRIKQNIWGNWNGYEGTRRVMQFGTSERNAKHWLADPGAYLLGQQEAREASSIIKHP